MFSSNLQLFSEDSHQDDAIDAITSTPYLLKGFFIPWLLDPIWFSPNKVLKFLQIRVFHACLGILALDKALKQGGEICPLAIEPVARKCQTFVLH